MRNRLAITVGVLGLSTTAWWGLRDHVVATEPIVVRAANLLAVPQREAPGCSQVLVKLKIVEADSAAVNAVWKKFAQDKADSARQRDEPLNTGVIETNATAATGIYSAQESTKILTELGKHAGTMLLGEPSITVASGRTASFINGEEVGVPTIVGVGPSTRVTTAYRSVGLSTVLTATALEDGGVRLKVICEWNQLDESTRTAGIPGLNSRRVSPSLMLLKPGHSVMVFVSKSDATATKPLTDSTVAADSHKEPKRVTFVVVTPEVMKPMELADVTATSPSPVPTPYAPVFNFEPPNLGRLLPVAPPAAWPFAAPVPFDGRFMPNPGAFGSPYQPIELTRLQHLQSAKSHLEQAGLTDQAEAILKEIQVEQRSLAKRELQRKERELEQLQKELESLRRTLSEETESRSE